MNHQIAPIKTTMARIARRTTRGAMTIPIVSVTPVRNLRDSALTGEPRPIGWIGYYSFPDPTNFTVIVLRRISVDGKI